MANVQFIDAGECCDCLHVVIRQAMTCIDDQAQTATISDSFANALKFGPTFARGFGIGIMAGMDFNGWRTGRFSRIELRKLGVNK